MLPQPQVYLEFHHFDTEADNDNVTVTARSWPSYQVFSGDLTDEVPFGISSENCTELAMKFLSNHEITASGFYGNATAMPALVSTTTTMTTTRKTTTTTSTQTTSTASTDASSASTAVTTTTAAPIGR